jgi:hypothetical protein
MEGQPMKTWSRTSLLLLAIAGSAAGQEKKLEKQEPGAHPGVDQKKVNRAVRDGIEFLRTAESVAQNGSHADELILLTYLHAGFEATPRFKELFDKVTKEPLKTTYSVALQAMVLEEYERVSFQPRIHQCAQFLADNQCQNGQWSYGAPTSYPDAVPVRPSEVPTGTPRKSTQSPRGVRDFAEPEPGVRQKPRVQVHLAVKKNRIGDAASDNSNSQYASLGVRACRDAGIVFPQELLTKARQWWIDTQEKGDKDAVATGPGGVARGWTYAEHDKRVSGSMTAGAIGALCIYDYILGIDFKKDRAALDGLAWLAKSWTVADNPGNPRYFTYYYLYALERAGMLYDSPRIGTHDWYLEGANFLLEKQNPDGSWGSADKDYPLDKRTWGTCFAILFLKQATHRLDVASTDKR